MATRKKIANKTVTDTGVIISFEDGTTLDCAIADLPKEIVNRLALHGLSQKVGDSYSGAESIAEARIAAETAWGNLVNGDWAVRASTGGILAEAIAELKGCDHADAVAVVNSLDDDTKKALQKDATVAAKIAELKAKKAAAKAKAADGSALDSLSI